MKTTILQKKNQSLANKSDGIIKDAEELRSFLGQRVVVAIFDNAAADLSVMGSLYLKDLPPHVAQNAAFPMNMHLRLDQFMLLSVIVMDPENLPYEVEDNNEVFIIYDNWGLTRHGTMEEATRDIENTIGSFTTASIDDFVVLIGKEFGPELTERFAYKVLAEIHKNMSY